MSAAALRVYGMIAHQEQVTDDHQAALEELVAWGVVGFDPARPNVPVALDPQEAARRRIKAELEEAERRVAHMAAIPSLADQLSVEFERAKWRAGGGSEFLGQPAEVNARLDHVVGQAESEILAAQPGGPRTRELLDRCVSRDTSAVSRGVVLKTLYRDTVRDNPVTAEYARLMSGPGAEYRTLVGPFQRCIVVDRKSAFISDHVSEGSAPHAAWYVTDRAVVGFIAAAFEDTWQRATPWHGELRCRGAVRDVDTVSGPDPGVRTSGLQRAVLRDMAAGIEQRITASRLGIGLRTLTEEIRVLKELAGARTLHELTYWWALSPDRLIDDGPVVAQADDAESAA
ncbi:hypothetical protein [Streptomyces sp. NPDC047868]|uniref:hypothetical protein n=1 Tax=Streptomyces sp. NPDC047868 TaxID=3155480 RepID=UPI0034572291